MNGTPYYAQHPLVHAANWLIDKIVEWSPLWGALLFLWVITDGVAYVHSNTSIFQKTHRWIRKIPCRFQKHDWGHYADGDFCYWCSKNRDE